MRGANPLLILMHLMVRELAQEPAAELIGMLVATVEQDHDPELAARNHADIGRGIVETSGLVDDLKPAVVLQLPSHRLRVMRAETEKTAVRALQRQLQCF